MNATPISDNPEIIIDPEFSALMPKPTDEELAELLINLRADKCPDPLRVWKGKNTLLDGHQRLSIFKKHGMPYTIVEVELADREAAINWIIGNQLGRRNLHPEARSYLRGRRYLAEKAAHGGDRRSDESSGNICHLKTDAMLGAEYAVAAKTIRNDGELASNVDTIARNLGEQGDFFRAAVLSRDVRATRAQLSALAALPAEQQQDVVTKALVSGSMPARQNQDRKKKPQKITVPFDPTDLAKALLRVRHGGPAYAARVRKAIDTVLAEHRAKQRRPKPGKCATPESVNGKV